MPATRSTSGNSFTLQIPRNSLKIAAIAFVAGLVLFVAVWLSNRDEGFYRADPAAPSPQQTAQVEPLPEPLAAAAGSSDMPDARPAPAPAEEIPQLVETAPPAPVAEAAPAPLPVAPATAAGGDRPSPIAGQSPPPQYPPRALQRGESGTVVVRVDVDAAGNPAGVTVIERSGSRDLDRAALQAVRRWRFTPAMRQGQPVPASIEIPFDFAPGR